MSNKSFQAVRGMNDILPEQTALWQSLENVLKETASRYGYQEIRFPIVEQTALFKRTIGEATDIVEKEMYTFNDYGDSLSLRPEGTAGCVRAAIEHGILHNQQQRLWYQGPMFRHESPQKNRFRQFHQFAVEAFGMAGPDIDAEQILMTARIFRELGIVEQLVLHINSLGSAASRQVHREKLIAYFTEHAAELDADSQRRLNLNPLRILDSKNPQMQNLIANAPNILDCLDDASRQHFAGLQKILDAANIAYEINSRLVRGLDYYGLTVYEWVTRETGAQNAVCAGGRYDVLVEQLGGSQATAAVGFALGMERVLTLFAANYQKQKNLSAYFILVSEVAAQRGLVLAEQLRNAVNNLQVISNCGGGSFKSQFKRADKSNATWALIIGETELAAGNIAVKNLRDATLPQQLMTLDELIHFLNQKNAP